MSIIEIQLCKEDRARLDRIIEGLDKINRDCSGCVKATSQAMHDMAQTLTAKAEEPIPETPTAPQDEPEAQTQELVNPTEETNTSEVTEGDTPPWEEKPTVTLEQIQKKVLEVAASYGGKKKEKARTIVNVYAKKVSELPEDKWTEVWEKLTALEKEPVNDD
jgi:hypothetical protein